MSQKRASRTGIQPTKPIGPLESTDMKKDGTIADLKPDALPHLHDQGINTPSDNMNRASHRVHIATRFTTRPSKCNNGTKRAAPSRLDRCGSRLGVSAVPLFLVGTNPRTCGKQKSGA